MQPALSTDLHRVRASDYRNTPGATRGAGGATLEELARRGKSNGKSNASGSRETSNNGDAMNTILHSEDRVNVDMLHLLLAEIKSEVDSFAVMEAAGRARVEEDMEEAQEQIEGRMGALTDRLKIRGKKTDELRAEMEVIQEKAGNHKEAMRVAKLQSKRYMDYKAFRQRLAASESTMVRLAKFGQSMNNMNFSVDEEVVRPLSKPFLWNFKLETQSVRS